MNLPGKTRVHVWTRAWQMSNQRGVSCPGRAGCGPWGAQTAAQSCLQGSSELSALNRKWQRPSKVSFNSHFMTATSSQQGGKGMWCGEEWRTSNRNWTYKQSGLRKDRKLHPGVGRLWGPNLQANLDEKWMAWIPSRGSTSRAGWRTAKPVKFEKRHEEGRRKNYSESTRNTETENTKESAWRLSTHIAFLHKRTWYLRKSLTFEQQTPHAVNPNRILLGI